MAKVPPYTALTMKWLRSQGFVAGVVEKWISRGATEEPWDPADGQKKPIMGFRKDFLGFIDIIAIDGTRTIGVQSTSGTMKMQHIKKIYANEHVDSWLNGGIRTIWLVTWTKKLVKRGGKARRWYPLVTEIKAGKTSIKPEKRACPF